MTIRTMTPADLQLVLDWAAAEGWNPGHEDAAAFLPADPPGFLIKTVEGAPVAAISVVNHTADHAFLGLYLCHPEYRGQGHGMAVWRAGLAHAGTRNVELDGVPAQQQNYAKSGFALCGKTVRYEGALTTGASAHTTEAAQADLPALLAADAAATGMTRAGFASAWFTRAQTRVTLLVRSGEEITGFATARRCGIGAKIGPLHARNAQDAMALLHAAQERLDVSTLFVDVPDTSPALSDLLIRQGFTPVFDTARMVLGTPPTADVPPFYAIATMELG
ncbi:GNAT family N-acetyltransferase [uncultured Roseobacter sp.]|uniref:GNAT family N-acetyltransferase n=1 Tax=uncultured Roseobacter sp. TaxID=114847 RepID=UPI00261C93B8|nr:GNAT family N-acetyltransferase [uncultured Roseobacter sp.]